MPKNIIQINREIEGINEKLSQIQGKIRAVATRTWEAASIIATREEIKTRAYEMADEIIAKYEGVTPVLMGLTNGGIFTLTAMAERFAERQILVEIDTRGSSSYGSGQTSGEVSLTGPGKLLVGGKIVFLVDDILDTGKTCKKMTQTLEAEGALSVHTVVMLDKPMAKERDLEIKADHVGFKLEGTPFLVGFGLDLYGGYLREKLEIRAVDQSTLFSKEEWELIESEVAQLNKDLVGLIAQRTEILTIPEKRVSVARSLGGFMQEVTASTSQSANKYKVTDDDSSADLIIHLVNPQDGHQSSLGL